MNLVLGSEQRLIRDGANQLFKERGGPARLRAVRDEGAASLALWKEIAELGWIGMAVPERWGGAGLGLWEQCILLEAAGRALAPEPLLGCAVLGPAALELAEDDGPKARWLVRVVTGATLATLAWDEADLRDDLGRTATEARPSDEGLVLAGHKRDVIAAAESDLLIVSARHVGTGLVDLYLVDRRAPGVSIAPQRRIDGLSVARVTFEDVAVSLSDRLSGANLLARLLDRAAVGAAAELVGVASAALEMTLTYLRERQQFGVAIGTFQALRHRAARMYIALELARSAVMAAARTVDAAAQGAPMDAVALGQAVALAKARANDAALLVGDEAIQMHGGIGMTDAADPGLYLKRARVAEALYGSASYHRDRYAALNNF